MKRVKIFQLVLLSFFFTNILLSQTIDVDESEPETCVDYDDGTVTVFVSGIDPVDKPLTYILYQGLTQIDNSGSTSNETWKFENIAPGRYYVTVYSSDLTPLDNTSSFRIDSAKTITITYPNNPISVCVNELKSIVPVYGGGKRPFASFTWSLTGFGTINPVNDSTVTYTHTAATSSTLKMDVVDGNGCPATKSATVIVNSLPTPSIIGSNSVCLNSLETYSTQSGSGENSWNWTVTGGTFTGQGNSSIDVTWTNVGNRTVQVNYKNSSGCYAAADASLAVAVHDLPTVTASATVSPICFGSNSTLNAGGTATSFTWDNGVGAGASHSVSPPTTTTYTVIGTDVNLCQNTASTTIIVTPTAVSGTVTAGTTPQCIGSTTTYTVAGTVLSGGTGGWTSSNPAVATVNATTGLVTAVSAGTCNIIYTVTGGCGGNVSDSKSYTVTANAVSGTVTAGTTPQCIGSTTTYTVAGTVLGGGTGGWTSSNPAVATVNATTGLVTAVSVGTCNIIYTVTGGCGGNVSDSKSYTVITFPTITSSNGDSNCGSGNLTLIATPSIGMVRWWSTATGGASPLSTENSYITSTAGTYYAEAFINGCPSAFRTPVIGTILSVPAAVASATDATVCYNGTINLLASPNLLSKYTWTYPSGATVLAQNPSIINALPAQSGNYILTTENTDGCTNSDTVAITVYSDISAGTIGTTPQSVCQNALPSTFTAPAATGGILSYSYNWQQSTDAGATWQNASGTNTNVNYTAPAVTQNIRYKREVTSGDCGTKPSNEIVITMSALPIISALAPSSACSAFNTTIPSTITGATSQQWQVSTNGGTSWANATGGVYSNGTTNTLAITGATLAMNNYQYKVIADNSCGPIESNISTLSVVSSTSITSHPQNAGICDMGDTSFTVIGAGTNLTYKWQRSTTVGGNTFVDLANNANHSGVNTSTLIISNAPLASMNGYNYRCVVHSDCGTDINSDAATLNIYSQPSITSTTPGENCGTGSVSLSAVASGGAIINWYTAATGGSFIGTGSPVSTPPISSTTSYYAEANNNGCLSAARVPALATINALPTVSASSNSPVCAAQNINLSGTATGNGAITYDWTGPNSYSANNTQNPSILNATALNVGNYILTATDSKCSNTASVSVTVNALPSPKTLSSDVTICSGNSTNITLGASESSVTYQLKRQSDNGNEGASKLGNGLTLTFTVSPTANETYYVEASNSNCSVTMADEVDVTVSPAITFTTSVTDVAVCADNNNGKIVVNVTSGTPTLYTMTPGISQGTNTFNSVGKGTYSITASNSACNTTNNNIIVGGPVAITISKTTNNETFAGNDGKITLVGSGGTGVLTYTIDNYGPNTNTTGNFTGLTAAQYYIKVKDDNSCEILDSATVANASTLSVSIDKTDVTGCFGDANGQIVITPTGGIEPFEYSLDNGLNTQDDSIFSGLTAGSYNIKVYANNKNDSIVRNITISQPTFLELDYTTTPYVDVSNKGSITITPKGGTENWDSYIYTITPPGSSQTGDSIFTNLDLGDYNVSVSDDSGCSTSGLIKIVDPSELVVTYDWSNPLCYTDQNTGTLTLEVKNGIGPFKYEYKKTKNQILWTNITKGALSHTFTNLSPADYNYKVTASNGKQVSGPFTIEPAKELKLSYLKTDDDGSANGTINLFTEPGKAGANNLSFSFNGGVFGPVSDFYNLAVGLYTVAVKDANSCVVSEVVEIANNAELLATYTTTPVSCTGGNNGTITANVTSGGGGYQYYINDVLNSTDNVFSSLTAGTYKIRITDVRDSSLVSNITVSEPSPIAANPIVVHDDGTSSGQITFNASGGNGGYTYSINNGTDFFVNPIFSGLSAGIKNVIIKDSKNCQLDTIIKITDLLELFADITVKNISCNGLVDGEITVEVTNGVAPFRIFFNGNIIPDMVTTKNYTGLSAGTYPILVMDSRDSSYAESVEIIEPMPLSIDSIKVTDVLGTARGSVEIFHSGGTLPYRYSANGGLSFGNDNLILDLNPGVKNIVVKDFTGCEDTSIAEIKFDTILLVDVQVTNLKCFEAIETDKQGIIKLTNINGLAPLNFLIDIDYSDGILDLQVFDSGTSTVLDGLPAGNYILGATDTDGRKFIDTILVTQPIDSMKVSIHTYNNCSQNPVTNPKGSIVTTVNNGQEPFNYKWEKQISGTNYSNYASTKDIVNVSNGVYRLTVTDNNGCKAPALKSNVSNLIFNVSKDSVNPACLGSATGKAKIKPYNPSNFPYSVSWSNGVTKDSIVNLVNGTFTYTVITDRVSTDIECEIIDSIQIIPQDTLKYQFAIDKAKCNSALDLGKATIDITQAGLPIVYNWHNNANVISDTVNQLGSVAKYLPYGSNRLVVTTANNCKLDTTFNIESNSTIKLVSYSATQPTCLHNTANGSLAVTMTGTDEPFFYNWSLNGNTIGSDNNTLSSIEGGSYELNVRNDVGCEFDTTINLTSNDSTNISFPTDVLSYNEVSCYGRIKDGKISASFNRKPYDRYLSWNNALTAVPYIYNITDTLMADSVSQVYSNLDLGSYNLRLTDTVNGCFHEVSQYVSAKDTLFLTFNFGKALCNSKDSTALVQARILDGRPPYYFNWDGETSDTIRQIDSLLSSARYIYKKNVKYGSAHTLSISKRICKFDTTYNVASVDSLFINRELTDTKCNFNTRDGQIVLKASGTAAPFVYKLNVGSADSIVSDTLRNLVAGQYRIIVSDTSKCIIDTTLSLGSKDTVMIDSVNVFKKAYCNGAPNDGAARLFYKKSTSASSIIKWENDSSVVASGIYPVYTKLRAGNRKVTVLDTTGCYASTIFTVLDSIKLNVTISNITHATCSNTGALSVKFHNGVPVDSIKYYLITDSIFTNPDSRMSPTGAISLGIIDSIRNTTDFGPGSYSFIFSDGLGCESRQAPVYIKQLEDFQIKADAKDTINICSGKQYQFNAKATSNGADLTSGVTYKWDLSDSLNRRDTLNPITRIKTPTQFELIATYGSYCVDFDTVLIEFFPVPSLTIVKNKYTDTVSAAGIVHKIEVNAGGLGFEKYSWTNSGDIIDSDKMILEPSVIISRPTLFKITGTTKEECTVSDSILIKLANPVIPIKAFTPNGDGKNEKWLIESADFYDVQVQIFNRWGEKVFSEEDYKGNEWDGTYYNNGRNLPIGTYYYVIIVNGTKGNKIGPFTGTVTIVR